MLPEGSRGIQGEQADMHRAEAALSPSAAPFLGSERKRVTRVRVIRYLAETRCCPGPVAAHQARVVLSVDV